MKSESASRFGVWVRKNSVRPWDQRRITREHAVHLGHISSAEFRLEHGRRSVVPVTTAQTGVVRDVPGALLEVRHEPTPLEHFGQQVRGLLTRQMHTTELGDRVVAVLEEDSGVQLFGTFQPNRRIDGDVALDVEVSNKLIKEQTTKRFRRSGVARKQRPLNNFGQVH